MFDLLAFLVLVFGVILCIRFFIATPYTVIGSSMMPNFAEKDRVIVEKLTQRFDSFQRGDVIVFVAPGKDVPYIKRVIGLPGETVLVQNGNVYICSENIPAGSLVSTSDGLNCEQLSESYLPQYTTTIASCGREEFPVNGGYFVMGDNRGRTTDSLCCFGIQCYEGANYVVPNSHLIGKVRVRLYPSFTKF
ncbi:MAG: signal peptidase I [Candidatus Peribacteria bacterium]|nr:signal peptidase I [Candidatus Peribacteria bacterium]